MCSESGDSGKSASESNESGGDEDDEKKIKEKKLKKKRKSKSKPEVKEANEGNDDENENKKKEPIVKNNENNKPIVIQIPKRVQSIFFKNLPVNSSRLELEEVLTDLNLKKFNSKLFIF
jgi:hypothetical protein